VSRPTLRGNVRAMPRTAWILFAGTFVNRFGTFVLPFLTLYLTKRGYSAPQAGIAVGAYGLGGIGAVTLGGLAADRLGRRNTIATSMFGGATFTLLLSQAHTLALILPLAACVGLTAELYRPASSALLTDLVPSERRVTAFTLSRLAVNLGWAFGLAIGGFLADRSFLLLFIGDAATSAAFGVIALAALPHGVRTARHEERRGAASRSMLADRSFLLFLGSVFATALIVMQSATTFPLHIKANHLTNADYGLLLSLNGIIIVFAELPLTSITMHLNKTRVMALGALLTGLAFWFIGSARTLPMLTGVIVVWTIGEMVESPVAAAFVADRAPESLRGRYQAAFGTMFALAAIVGPIAGTTLFHARQGAVWGACGVLGVVGAVLALSAGRARMAVPAGQGPG
jgi:MFS family permease